MSPAPRRSSANAIAADRPDQGSWLRRTALALIAAEAVLLPLAFDPRASVVFALPKSWVGHAVFYGLLATSTAALIVGPGRRSGLTRVHIAVAFFVAAETAATVLSPYPAIALAGAPGRYLGLLHTIEGAILATTIAWSVSSATWSRAVGAAALAAAAIVMAYGALQAIGHDPIPWDVSPSSRIFSTFGNAGPLSSYLLIVAAATAWLLTSRWTSLGRGPRGALLVMCALAIAEVLLTATRGALLALPAALVAVVAVGVRQGSLPLSGAVNTRRSVVAAVLAVVTFAAILALTPAGERLGRLVTGGDKSTDERSIVYAAALTVVRAHPWLGTGPDTFYALFPSVEPEGAARVIGRGTSQSSTHSWILKVLTDAGVIGLSLYLVLIALLLSRAWRRVRANDPLGGLAIVTLVPFLTQGVVNVNDVSTEWIFWVAVGLVMTRPQLVMTGSPANGGRSVASASPRRRGTRRVARDSTDLVPAAVALVLMVVLSLASLGPLSASEFIKLSVRTPDPELAVAAAAEAARRDPGRGDTWNTLGIANANVGRLPDAIEAFSRASKVEPFRPEYWANLADQELRLALGGRTEMRERALSNAAAGVSAAPNDPDAHYRYAKVLLPMGKPSDAIGEGKRAIALFRDTLEYVRVIENAYEIVGDFRSAIEWQLRAVDLGGRALLDRLRLAGLYAQVGEPAKARELLQPPQVVGADRACEPVVADAEARALCFRVLFRSEAPLRADPGEIGSVTRPASYSYGGVLPPPGTRVTYDAVHSVATIQLPAGAIPPAPDESVAVTGVTDIYGGDLAPKADRAALPALSQTSSGVLTTLVAGLERAGRYNDAIVWQLRYMEREATRETRLHLARLYLASGDRDKAAHVMAPPRVVSADRACEPIPPAPAPDPLCFRVSFTSEAPLRDDPGGEGSVVALASYVYEGRTLPPGTRVTFDAVHNVATIQLPKGSFPPAPSAAVTVDRVTDAFGTAIAPGSNVATMPDVAGSSTTFLAALVTAYEKGGRVSDAIRWQLQFIQRDASVTARRHLADLYVAAGDHESARAVFAPPRLKAADRLCQPQARCLRLLFETDVPLQADPARPDAATRPSNYSMDGLAIPSDVSLSYDPVHQAIEFIMPGGAPVDGTRITVQSVANVYGAVVPSDASTAVVR